MKIQEKGFYLPLKRTRYLLTYSLLLHMLAVISVSLLAVSMIVKLLFITAVFISQFLHIYRLGFINKYCKRPIALLNPVTEYWQIRYANGALTPHLSLESAWVTRLAVIVNLKLPNNKRLTVFICKDAVDKDQFRQLRVRIRLAFFQQ